LFGLNKEKVIGICVGMFATVALAAFALFQIRKRRLRARAEPNKSSAGGDDEPTTAPYHQIESDAL
jgi:hypothetical protein